MVCNASAAYAGPEHFQNFTNIQQFSRPLSMSIAPPQVARLEEAMQKVALKQE